VPSLVVPYRHRSVSKPMFVVFVLLLLLPAVVAGAAFVAVAFRDGVSTLELLHAAKSFTFFVPVAWLILKPSGRIVFDGDGRQLIYKPGWPKAAAHFPLDALASVDV